MLFNIEIETVLSLPKIRILRVDIRFSNKRRVIFTAAISKSMAFHNAPVDEDGFRGGVQLRSRNDVMHEVSRQTRMNNKTFSRYFKSRFFFFLNKYQDIFLGNQRFN